MNAMAVLHPSATTSDIPSDAWSPPKEIVDGKGYTALCDFCRPRSSTSTSKIGLSGKYTQILISYLCTFDSPTV